MGGMDFGMNQELKRKGGFVDFINAKSAISQEQLVSIFLYVVSSV
jgi:hypothetical protein